MLECFAVFNELVEFMISGPAMVQVLEGEDAIKKNRELMGATDPKKADKGTIRADYAESIQANAVHGSDAPETAAKPAVAKTVATARPPGTQAIHFFAASNIALVNPA